MPAELPHILQMENSPFGNVLQAQKPFAEILYVVVVQNVQTASGRASTRHNPVESVKGDIRASVEDVRESLEAILQGLRMLSVVPGTGVTEQDVARVGSLADTVFEVVAPTPPEAQDPPAGEAPTTEGAGLQPQPLMRELLRQVIRGLPAGQSFTPQDLLSRLRRMPEASDIPDMSKTLYNTLNALTRSGDITRLGRGLCIAPRLQQPASQGPIPEQSPAAGGSSKEEYTSDPWPRPSAA